MRIHRMLSRRDDSDHGNPGSKTVAPPASFRVGAPIQNSNSAPRLGTASRIGHTSPSLSPVSCHPSRLLLCATHRGSLSSLCRAFLCALPLIIMPVDSRTAHVGMVGRIAGAVAVHYLN